jgi:hypothetical protein
MTSTTNRNPKQEPYGYFITHTERLEIRTMDDIKYVKKRLKNLKAYFESIRKYRESQGIPTLGVKGN